MLIRETFATTIQERIEPVVKVSDRRPAVMLDELANLVVTPQWERYLAQALDAYTDAVDRDDEQGVGIWISGFFGSGKSLLMKVLGMLLEGGELQGQPTHQVFLGRLPASSPDRANIQRFLTICQRKLTTTAIGGNLHSMIASTDDPLALTAFKLFAAHHGYTHNWPLAWAVEYQIDARGMSAEFRQRVSDLCGVPWDDVAADPEIYAQQMYKAATAVLPDLFNGETVVEKAEATARHMGITPATLVERLRRWCVARDGAGHRHKVLLQLDEVGQWISSGNPNERTMQVQALTESAAANGGGRIWVAVTAHGDVQALQQSVQQELYAKIIKRFAVQCKLSNDDISQVVEERLLRKTQKARVALNERFQERSGEITEMGTLQQPRRVYPAPDAERFALFYPYLPWTLTVIPDVVKGIAQAAGRDEALTGSNRTMIGVVQGAIIETNGLLDSPVGKLLCLADLYDQLASDVPIETKTDINRIAKTVPQASAFTTRVGQALFLLGKAEYVPTTLENVTRSLIGSLDANAGTLRGQTKAELERLVEAGYVKQVGEEYVFLSTQQRSFQDKVRARQEELLTQTYELSQALKDYDSEDALRFDRVPIKGREIALKLEIDGRTARNPSSYVALRVFSPFQRTLDPEVADDAALRQRSAQNPDSIIFRMAEVGGLRRALALAVATTEVADRVISASQASGPELEVARQAKQVDLASHRGEVRRLLGQSVRGGAIFFRGTAYQLAAGESPSAAVRATLSEVLPSIYSRFSELPHRIANEEAAVKAALHGQTSNSDLQALGIYRADGTLNDSHPLLSTLRGRLPLAEQDQGAITGEVLRNAFERPPFGWDGNCVKVGLAALLRTSACRLIESSQILTDPSNPEILQILTKELRFKGVRVQGVRTELSVPELLQIRGYMETIFGSKPALVAATLSNMLGEKLGEMAKRVQTVHAWAETAQCPLPVELDSGSNLLGEIVATTTPAVRLPRFLAEADRILHLSELLEGLSAFQRDHGATFLKLRDFYNSMVNADVDLDEVRHFIEDWRTVARERSVTDLARWNELFQAHQSAQQALSNQISTWQEETKSRVANMEADLPAQVRSAGVPEELVMAKAAELSVLLQSVRERLQRPKLSLAEIRGIRTALTSIELNLAHRLQELRAPYRSPGQGVEEGGKGKEVQKPMRWSEIAGPRRISSVEELDQVLGFIKESVLPALRERGTIVIE